METATASGAVRTTVARPLGRHLTIATKAGDQTGFVLTFLLLLVVPLPIVLGAPTEGSNVDLCVIQWVIVAFTALRVARCLAVGGQPLTTMVWTFSYVVFGVAPLAQIIIGEGLPDVADPYHAFLMAQLLLLVSFVAFELGRALTRKTFPVTISAVVPDPQRARLLALVAVPLALPYVQAAGLGNLFASRAARAAAVSGTTGGTAGTGIVEAFARVPPLVALVSLLYLVHRRRTAGHRVELRDKVLIALAIGILVLIANPISAPRFVVATVIVAVYFAVPRSRTATRLFFLGLILFALVLFPYADYFRRTTTTAIVREPVATQLAGPDYDSIKLVAESTSYVEDNGFSFGHRLLSSALFFVPRAVWPSKDRDSGTVVGEYVGGRNLNLSMPPQGEFYLDFGFPGVFLGFVLLGLLVSSLERSYAASGGGILVAILAGYSLLLLRGSLLQATGTAVVMVVAARLLRVRSRNPRSVDR